jgi:hypothetical protein
MFPHRIAGTVGDPIVIIIGMSIRVIVGARALRAIVISNFTPITINITAIVFIAVLHQSIPHPDVISTCATVTIKIMD